MNQILIVEDEPFLRNCIKELLKNNGYDVLTASCVAEALQYVYKSRDINLYLIDVWLPDGDGFEICKKIRTCSNAPILFLTACDDEDSIVHGLNIGGDDYITKPFRTAELLSRIGANIRRVSMEQEKKILKSREITLDILQQRGYKQNQDLCLTPIEYELLYVLMNNAGAIMKRDVLLEKLWDMSGKYVENNTLSVSVSRLRNKIGKEYIETIHGFGYRFMKNVHS